MKEIGMRNMSQRAVLLASILWAVSLAAFGQVSTTIFGGTATGASATTAPAMAAVPAATPLPSSIGLKSSPSLDSAAAASLAAPGPSALAATDASGGDQALITRPASGRANDQQSNFQRFVQQATGRALPIYGQNLFSAPAGYAPISQAVVPNDYLLGPGDEIRLQIWGAIDSEQRLLINRHGQINLPKVGVINLTGVRAGDLESVLRGKIGRVFTHFNLNATLGRLRSIQIYVVGQARQPGTYTVSSLSTLINALFEVGGPSSNGSMRNIQLKRDGRVVGEMDLYSFIARGDRGGDVPLQPGDVIVIPPVGPRVAVLGAFEQPAIYELKGAGSVGEVLALGGGVSVLATPGKALLERIDPTADTARHIEDLALDTAGLKRPLRDGDILTLIEISPQFANAVTLSGNVAVPMRYPFTPGMRVSDLVINNNFLVPVSYWLNVNAAANMAGYSMPEVNLDYATVQRLDPNTLRTEIIAFNLSKALLGDPKENLLLKPGDLLRVYGPNDPGADTLNTITLRGEIVGGVKRFAWRPGFTVKDLIPNAEWLIQRYNYWQKPSGKELRNDINWDYAQILRRVPQTLETKALTFNLGEAVLGQNPAQNLTLEPGDQISLYTTSQMAIPVAKRIRLVTLAGEVAVPGVYQVQPGENLPQLIHRVGGLTPQAYLYGAEFTRESTRQQQQKNLDSIISKLETQMQAEASRQSANITSTSDAQAQLAAQQRQLQIQQQQLARMKTLKSNGRISLELPLANLTLAALPALPLEDGDALTIPSRPGYVSAVGEVYNENAIIHRPGKTVGDVLTTAGVSDQAELDNAFVLRADGSVKAARDHNSLFRMSSFEDIEVMPGDTVVVPPKLDRETGWTKFVLGLKDWTQILYQLGLGAAAWKTLN